jgi:hypothetical protein
MERLLPRFKSFFVVLTIIALIVSLGGCRSLITTAAILVKGTDADADCKELHGKKVVVVCRPVATLAFGNPSVAADLAKQVSILLRTNVPKITVIDQQKVAQWTDSHDWSEYPEVGKAVGADMVVGIDLQDFSLRQGQTLYQGRAGLMVNVYDCAKSKEPIFERSLPRVVYPPNTGIPSSDLPENEFRRKFVQVLANQIARHFYSHDPHADVTQDLDAL